jgi:branched-chain amino acid transport system substrate-binding protein
MNSKALMLAVLAIIVIVGFGYYALTGFSVMPAAKTPLPSVERQEVKIGVIMPFTGPSSDAAEYVRKGLEIAEKEINSNAELRYKVKLIFEDSQYKPELAVTGIQKLINFDNAKFVIGAYGSSETVAIAPITEKSKVILMVPGSQATSITTIGDFVFRVQVNTRQEAEFFSKFLYGKIGKKRLSIIALNNEYRASVIEDYSNYFGSLGGNLGLVQKYEATTTSDYRTFLLKIKEDNAQALLVVANRKTGGLIMKQAGELGLGLEFFAPSVIEGQELLDTAGSAVEGLIYPYPFDDSSSNPAQKAFQEKFVAAFGVKSEMLSANSFDALTLLSSCFEKVGVETTAIRDCLYATQNYQGASGILSFDKFGDVKKPFILKTVKDGEFVKLE